MAAPGKKTQQETLRVRMLNGKIVTPVLYNGKNIGQGKYFAGQVDGSMILDQQGVPLKFNSIGDLCKPNQETKS
jgi:hypothetical protein